MKTLGDDFCVDDDVCAQSDAAMTDMVNIPLRSTILHQEFSFLLCSIADQTLSIH